MAAFFSNLLLDRRFPSALTNLCYHGPSTLASRHRSFLLFLLHASTSNLQILGLYSPHSASVSSLRTFLLRPPKPLFIPNSTPHRLGLIRHLLLTIFSPLVSTAEAKMASFGTSSAAIKEKPVVVRVKRKPSQASLDAFWLEINGRPLKRPFLGFENLSISDYESKEILKTKRLLVQHIETVRPFEAIEDVLQSLLPNSNCSKDFMRKIEMRKNHFKQDKKQGLRSVARQEHEELVTSARYEQIWKSRRGESDSLSEFCHLYDVVRVDTEDERPIKKKEMQHISAEDNAILCNYLPLLREYIPAVAEEMESEIKAYLSSEGSCSDSMASAATANEDDFVYDLYTVEDKFTVNDEDMICDYPLLQVEDDQDFNDMPDSEYDSEDSNAEDHLGNDYPDEESSDVEDDELDPFGDLVCSNSDYEEEIARNNSEEEASNNEDEDVSSECSDSVNEDEDNLRWGYR